MDGYGGSERALRMKRCASGWPGGSGWFRMGGGERRELLQQQTAFGFVAGSDQTMRCGANQIRPDYKAMVPSLQCLVDQWENNQQSVERSRGEVTPEGS